MLHSNHMAKNCVIFNLRVNSPYRLVRLIMLLQKLSLDPDIYFSIRIRGRNAVLAQKEIVRVFEINSNSNFRIFVGEKFKQWKMNTYIQVIESNCEQFLLLQEDHYLISPIDELNNYIKECFDKKIDIGYITAWHTYKEFRERAQLLNEFRNYVTLTSIPWDVLNIEKPRYLVPLVAYFSRDFLVKILLSPRPFWRKYPANSPFDFEQSPWAKRLLPIKIGFSNQELFACIDDDIDVPGSSLQSRNLYPLDNLRKGEHHATAPFGIQKNLDLFKRYLPVKLGRDSIFESLKNQKSKFIWSKISNWVYRSARNIDSVFYSIHNLLNYLFNFPEIHYKLNAKLHNSMKSKVQNDY
jgi:hypothetical protein